MKHWVTKEQFRGWAAADRDAKMRSLANVIARYEMTGFVGGVGLLKFNSMFQGSILPRKVLRSHLKFTEAYHFGCLGTISCVLGYQVLEAKNLTDKVDFVFDKGVPYLDDCIAQYPKTLAVLPEPAQKIAGTVIPGGDREIAALQAADMLGGAAQYELRTGEPYFLTDILRTKKIHQFDCMPTLFQQIPRAVSRINEVWSMKNLMKAKKKGGNDRA